jgi:uncharacterized phage protein (TIGR01671 family)
MDREIKFRAWNKTKKQMVQSYVHMGKNGHIYIAFTFPDDEYIPLQYTGLKDKNGKEIYEGDILSCKSKNGFEHRSTLRLGWSEDEQYGWCWDSGTIVTGVDFINERYGVIGNIYENPELLQ